MAKHNRRTGRRAPRALLVGTAALAVAAGQVVESTPIDLSTDLLAHIYGVGGSNDKNGVNIPRKLNGELIDPDPEIDTYHPIVYPAGIPIDPSVEDAIPTLRALLDGHPAGQEGVVVGYSEGAVVVEYTRRNLQANLDAGLPAPSPDDIRFIQIAGPSVPNGGIYARFTVGIIPGFTTTGPTVPTEYDTTYVTVEYDTVADFPAYFNPLAIANALLAFFPTHADPSYDAADIDPLPPEPITKTVTNSAGGTDTYVFIPVDELQILWPIRLVAEAAGVTPLTEPFLDLVEPTLRVLVDMGYTDRVNANPEVHVPFSLFTPPDKIAEAAAALPGAIEEGWENFQDGTQALLTEPSPDDAEIQTADSRQPDSDDTADTAESDDRDVRPGIRLLRQLREEVRDALAPRQRPGATTTPEADDDADADDVEPEVEDDDHDAEEPSDADESAA